MKKITLSGSLLLLFLYTFPAVAQTFNPRDAVKQVKEYEIAYNLRDLAAVMDLYSDTAVRTTNGQLQTGKAAIRISLTDDFRATTIQLRITLKKFSQEPDGSLRSTGSYHVWGTDASGGKFDISGKFDNRSVRENGKWKIVQSVLVQ